MSKKTESLEIRVSPELKTELQRMSAARDRTMSDVVRDLIARQIDGRGPNPTLESEPIMIRNTSRHLLRAGLVALPALALGLVYTATLQTPAVASTEARIFFAELDQNRDGSVSAEEYAHFLTVEEDFIAEPDCNEQGEPCSAEELATAEVDRIDADGDGSVSYAELEAVILRGLAEEFLDFDIDENGFVTPDEAALAMAFFAREDGEDVTAECVSLLDSETTTGAQNVCGDPHETMIEIAERDTDRDGRVSLLEFLAN